MSDDSSNDKKRKGFAGLNSLVSDVTEDVKRATPPSSPPPSPPQPQGEPGPSPAEGSLPSNAGKKGIGGIGWLIAGVIGFAILIFNSGDRSSPPASNDAPPSFYAPAAEAPAQVPATTLPVVASPPGVKKPPVGRNEVLSVHQIRYCLTEKIRIAAFESVINDNYDHEVDRFNAMVSDYNSRCGEFRYRENDVERVERELDPVRESIIAAARSEWVRTSLGLQLPSKDQNAETTSATRQVPKTANVPRLPERSVSCQKDAECPDILFCVRGRCVPQAAEGGACDRDVECAHPNQCIRGRCAGNKSASPNLLQPTPAGQKPTSGMPANAEIEYPSRARECKRGYHPIAGECEAVRMPANAEADYSGRRW